MNLKLARIVYISSSAAKVVEKKKRRTGDSIKYKRYQQGKEHYSRIYLQRTPLGNITNSDEGDVLFRSLPQRLIRDTKDAASYPILKGRLTAD